MIKLDQKTRKLITLAANAKGDKKILDILTKFASKDSLELHELTTQHYLKAVLVERHGQSETEHIETLIKNKLTA